MKNALTLVISLTFLFSLDSASAGNQPVEFHRQYVDGPYGQIHVLSSSPAVGNWSGTPMACFAPNPASGRYFRLFMEEMGRDRVMIAPDYPGLGASDAPPAMPDMSGYTDAMAAALDALGYGAPDGGKVDVCGYHTGALAIEGAPLRSKGSVSRKRQELHPCGPPLETSCLKGSWKQIPYSRPARAKR